MGKHTPEPYLREGKTVYALTDFGRGPENRWTALVQGDGQRRCPEQEVLAVAALFQASRDLYEAADHAEAIMSMVEPHSNKAEYLECLAKLRTAIARARGEVP